MTVEFKLSETMHPKNSRRSTRRSRPRPDNSLREAQLTSQPLETVPLEARASEGETNNPSVEGRDEKEAQHRMSEREVATRTAPRFRNLAAQQRMLQGLEDCRHLARGLTEAARRVEETVEALNGFFLTLVDRGGERSARPVTFNEEPRPDEIAALSPATEGKKNPPLERLVELATSPQFQKLLDLLGTLSK